MRATFIVLVVYTLNCVARFAMPEGNLSRLGSVLPQILVTLSALAVVSQFSSGDRPRRAWLLLAGAAAAMVSTRFVQWSWPEEYWHELVLMVSNLLFFAGVFAFHSIMRGNPLLLPLSKKRRRLVRLATLVSTAAAGVGAYVLLNQVLEHGWSGLNSDWTRLAALVGLLCDAAVFVLSLHLAALVMPMAGGSAARPYLLIALAGLVFLGLDLAGFLLTRDFGYGDFGPLLRIFVLLAWAIYTSAAIEQFLVLRETRAR
jgi:hypothetical protein